MRQRISIWPSVLVRGGALFLAGFTLVGLVGEARGGATDIGLWFVDLRDLGPVATLALLALFGAILLGWVLQATPRPAIRRAASLACLAMATLAARDVVRFANAVSTGLVRPATPIPLSALTAVGLAFSAFWIWRDRGLSAGPRGRVRVGVGAAALFAAASFPLLQMWFFGTTDYRRSADAAVVFGARVYASGSPSPLLADRIATAVELYRSGLVPVLIMSGGDGADGFNEAAVMRDEAVAAGVDPAAILVDASGVTTEASVNHALQMIRGRRLPSPRLIAVSQAYHLPRIQLAFSAAGIDVLTVPAADPVAIGEMPLLVVREVPAFWLYYLRACLG